MKKYIIHLISLFVGVVAYAQTQNIDQKVEELLQKMTLEEKIGQLNQ